MQRRRIGTAVLAVGALLLGVAVGFAGDCEDYEVTVTWGDGTENEEYFDYDNGDWEQIEGHSHANADATAGEGTVHAESEVWEPQFGWIPEGLSAKAYASNQATMTIEWLGEGEPPDATASVSASGSFAYWVSTGQSSDPGVVTFAKASGAATIEPGSEPDNHWEDAPYVGGGTASSSDSYGWSVGSDEVEFSGSCSFTLTIAAHAESYWIDPNIPRTGQCAASADSTVTGGFGTPTIDDP